MEHANFKLDLFFFIIPKVFDHTTFFEKGIFAYEKVGVHAHVKKYAEIRYFFFTLLNDPLIPITRFQVL